MTTTIASVARVRVSAALLAAALGACAHAPPRRVAHAAADATVFDPREAVLRVDTVRGEPFDVAALRGRAVIVAVILVNDLGGQGLARNLERLAAAHPDDLAVVLLAADAFDAETLRMAMEVFADVVGLRHAALGALPDALRDGSSVFGAMDQGTATVLVNRAGRVARRVDGTPTYAALEALVAPALPPPGTAAGAR